MLGYRGPKSRMVPGLGWSGEGKAGGEISMSIMTHIHGTQQSWREIQGGPQMTFSEMTCWES